MADNTDKLSPRMRRMAENRRRKLTILFLLSLILGGICIVYVMHVKPAEAPTRQQLAHAKKKRTIPEPIIDERSQPIAPPVEENLPPEPEIVETQETASEHLHQEENVTTEAKQDETDVPGPDETFEEIPHEDDGEETEPENDPLSIDNQSDGTADDQQVTSPEEEGEEIEIDIQSRSLLFTSDPARNDEILANYLEMIRNDYKSVDKDDQTAGSDENKVVK